MGRFFKPYGKPKNGKCPSCARPIRRANAVVGNGVIYVMDWCPYDELGWAVTDGLAYKVWLDKGTGAIRAKLK